MTLFDDLNTTHDFDLARTMATAELALLDDLIAHVSTVRAQAQMHPVRDRLARMLQVLAAARMDVQVFLGDLERDR